MISFEGLSLMLLNFLRIPPGTSVRKNYGNHGGINASDEIVTSNDLINAMVDITVDDVCIGHSPFYLKYKEDIPKETLTTIEEFKNQVNKIAKWAAKDLLKRGYSVYDVKYFKEEGKFVIMPHLDDVSFYLNKFGEVVVANEENEELDPKETLVYVNYDREGLVKIESPDEGQPEIQVTPVPIQLKNVNNVAKDLYLTQKSIVRYRSQLSRIIRLITVDVGISQGEKQQEVVDTIAEAVNADSMSLMNTTDQTSSYDDNIPILPNRKGVGKPELVSDIPSFNIGELTDLDSLKGDLALAMRFPKTYADFSQALGETAASTVRGDVRYSRMVDHTRSLMEDITNDFFNKGLKDKAETYEVSFNLTQYPQPEDEDVISAIGSFKDFLDETYDLVIKKSESKFEATAKVQMLEDLLGNVSNIPAIQNFLQDLKDIIDNYTFEGEDDNSDEISDLEGDNSDEESPAGGFDLSSPTRGEEEPSSESEEPEESEGTEEPSPESE